MPIDIKETSNANETKLEIMGTIDEKALLPLHADAKILRIDLGRVSNINSIGVRNFLLWGEKHATVKSIRLDCLGGRRPIRSGASVSSRIEGLFGLSDPIAPRSEWLMIRQ